MPTELKKLSLTELSLVDRPANPLAMAPIFKADNSNGENMTDDKDKMEDKIKAYMKEKSCSREEAMKALGMKKSAEDFEAEVEALKADFEKVKAENEALRKSLLDEGYKITAEGVEKKAPEEFIEVEGERINKADIPAPILKRLEEAEVAKAEAAISKRCEETLPNVSEVHARVLLKAYDGLEEEQAKSFAEFMQALDNLFDEMTEEVGKSAVEGDMADPKEALEKMISKYADEHDVSKAKATAEVTKSGAGRELYKQVMKKG